MEFRDALLLLRRELGKTQVELASSLHVNVLTINRWEQGKTLPYRSIAASIINYAKSHSASKYCIDQLIATSTKRIEKKSLSAIEHSTLEQIVEDVSFPIYVCDMETDEILYLNKKALEMIGDSSKNVFGCKCYQCLMHRDTPCDFCHKNELKDNEFSTYDAFRPFDGTAYRIQGKIITWCGHRAQIRCISNVGHSVNINVQRERENNYANLLRTRKEYAADCVGMAHFNLTKNSVKDIQSDNEAIIKILMRGSVNDVLKAIRANNLNNVEQSQFDCISDRSDIINFFYNGKTHISIRHNLKGDRRLYETTFDLLQNPTTFDVEAIAVLRNITDGVLVEEVASALLGLDYETIVLIDAETGEAHPLTEGHISGVVEEQKNCGDNVAGVEAYLRAHCVDDDVDRVIYETGLENVREQLKTKRRYTVSYSINQENGVIHKRTFFTYLDKSHTTILCAMQDISETYRDEVVTHDRLSATLDIIKEIAGLDIARYDFRTKTLYSSDLMKSAGYSSVTKNAPETFIRNGHVAPESEAEVRRFFAELGKSKVSSTDVALAAVGGGFHWYKIKAETLMDENGEPEQAVIVYKDIDDQREQTAGYRKWKQSLAKRDQTSFTLFSCNLNRGTLFGRSEGALLDVQYRPVAQTFDGRTQEYADLYIHPDDRKAYVELINSASLLHAYRNGSSTAVVNYREKIAENEYRWIHLSVEMAQYPDNDDIEVFMLFEKAV